MIIRTATAEDRDRWDAYALAHGEATPYHRFGWKVALESAYGHHTQYLIAETDGNVVGILPLARLSPPLLKPHWSSLPFCDIGGCLADTSDAREALLQKATELAGTGLQLRERGREPIEPEQAQATKVSMLLALEGSAETLWASFKAKLRSQIRKAEKNGLTVELQTGPAGVSDFYTVLAENMRTLGSPVHGRAWFDALAEQFGDDCVIAVVYQDTTPVAAGLVLRSGARACIPWASSLRSHNHLSPNMLLYWSLLSHCANTGCLQFDFGRSTLEEGTYRFKRQWGAVPYPLYWHGPTETPATSVSGTPSAARRLVETCWRHLPLAVTVSLGPHLRRYISL